MKHIPNWPLLTFTAGGNQHCHVRKILIHNDVDKKFKFRSTVLGYRVYILNSSHVVFTILPTPSPFSLDPSVGATVGVTTSRTCAHGAVSRFITYISAYTCLFAVGESV